jgi:methionyl-tRNA synthetase
LAGFEDKVFYVWFDAPIGYISFTKEWANAKGWPQAWEHYWQNPDCKIVHFLGKDNIAFHTVIWPGMLMASGYASLPYRVQAYEFLNLEGKKFSTSRNWGIDAREALEWFPADYWRYYLLSILPERSDANFSWDEFRSAVNSDLADVYGNLLHRCITFTHSQWGGLVPQPFDEKDWSKQDQEFACQAAVYEKKVRQLLEEYKLQEALRTVMEYGRLANKYFSVCVPWKKVKEGGAGTLQAATCIYLTLNACRSLSLMFYPFIPTSAQKAYDYLNAGSLSNASWGQAGLRLMPPTHPLAPLDSIAPLFRKIEVEELDKYRTLVTQRSIQK